MTDPRGEMVEDLLAKYNLTLLNKGSAKTFIGSQGSTIIDITVCDRLTSNYISKWRVDKKENFSDHRRIAFNVKAVKDKIFKKPVGWRYATANWLNFQQVLENYLGVFTTPVYWTKELVESKFNQIYKSINKALKLTCNSVTAYVGKSIRPPWWSQDLSKARAKMRLLIKRQKKTQLCTLIW